MLLSLSQIVVQQFTCFKKPTNNLSNHSSSLISSFNHWIQGKSKAFVWETIKYCCFNLLLLYCLLYLMIFFSFFKKLKMITDFSTHYKMEWLANMQIFCHSLSTESWLCRSAGLAQTPVIHHYQPQAMQSHLSPTLLCRLSAN